MSRQTELIEQARARGITVDQLPDDARIKDIEDALAALNREDAAKAADAEAKAAAAAETASQGTADERFPLDRLIAESDAFFGRPSYEAVGAFEGIEQTDLTVAEGKARIEEWLQGTVQTVEIQPEEAQIA